MADILPFPRLGELFVDVRGEERTMRVSLHPERGLIVLSLWAGATCRASFQLPLDEAARLSEVLGSVTVSNAPLAVTDASLAVTHAAPAVTDPATVPVEDAALAS